MVSLTKNLDLANNEEEFYIGMGKLKSLDQQDEFYFEVDASGTSSSPAGNLTVLSGTLNLGVSCRSLADEYLEYATAGKKVDQSRQQDAETPSNGPAAIPDQANAISR